VRSRELIIKDIIRRLRNTTDWTLKVCDKNSQKKTQYTNTADKITVIRTYFNCPIIFDCAMHILTKWILED